MASPEYPSCPYCGKPIRPGSPIVLRGEGMLHLGCHVAATAEASSLGERLARELEEIQDAIARLEGERGD